MNKTDIHKINNINNISINNNSNHFKPFVSTNVNKHLLNPKECCDNSTFNLSRNPNNININNSSNNSHSNINIMLNNINSSTQINQSNPNNLNSQSNNFISSPTSIYKDSKGNIIGFTNEKRNNTILIKKDDKEEYEYSSIRTMQKELMQKIYSKKSGEILNVLRKSNENIKSSRVTLYDSFSDKKFETKSSNIEKLEIQEIDSELNIYNFKNNESLSTINKNTTRKDLKSIDYAININTINQLKENNLLDNFKPEMIGIKQMKKKSDDISLKTKVIISNQNKINNNVIIENLEIKNNNLIHKNSLSNNKIPIEEKTVYLTESCKSGFPKITVQGTSTDIYINEHDFITSSKGRFLKKNSIIKNTFTNNINTNNFHRTVINTNPGTSTQTLQFINKSLFKKSNQFYCPHCEHCNNIQDDNLESYFNMKEAKNIVKKSLDYILNNYQTDQSYLDFLLQNNPQNSGNQNVNVFNSNNNSYDKNNVNNSISKINSNNSEIENIKNQRNINRFDIETFLTSYPKHSNNRTVLKLVTHFLDALINDKISLDAIAGTETLEKLKQSLICQGLAFKEYDGELEFDKELDLIFDVKTKEKIRKLFRSKKINYFYFTKLEKYLNMKKLEDENTSNNKEDGIESRKRFMLLFL